MSKAHTYSEVKDDNVNYVAWADRIYKEYSLGTQVVVALKAVSLLIREGEFLAIAGPSGSGKTTVLNIIGCIDAPTEGSVYINGTEVREMSESQLALTRSRNIGFIFQTFNLMPILSAAENVEYPLLNRRIGRRQRNERVKYFLNLVGLGKFLNHRPNEMSGGQRQRVAIARALAGDPKIVLADEPTANLDSQTGESILDLMRQINDEFKTTFIFSTHDPKVIALAKRVVRITSGEIVDSGYDFSKV
jgi:putative ABC transport system ATP-binding protein